MKDLTQGNLTKNLISQAVPAILSTLLARTHTTIDGIMAGQYLGEAGLAATGATAGLVTVLNSLFWGVNAGMGIFLASKIAASKDEHSVSILKHNVTFYLIISLLISSLAIAMHPLLFSAISLDVSMTIYDNARTYFLLIMTTLPLTALNGLISTTMITLGNTSYPLCLSVVSCIGNVAFNYLFMVVCNLGVAGAALGTISAGLITFVLYLIGYKKLVRTNDGQKIKFHPNWNSVLAAWKIALPCMGQQCLMYLASVVTQASINTLSSSAIAGYTVCLAVYDVLTIFFVGGTRAISTYAAQCCSKGKQHLVRKGFFRGLSISYTLSIPAIILMMIFPDVMAQAWIPDPNSPAVNVVVEYVHTCFPFIALAILNAAYHSLFRGVLRPKINMVSTGMFSVIRSAITIILTPTMGITGVFLGFIIAWCSESVLTVSVFLSGKWLTIPKDTLTA